MQDKTQQQNQNIISKNWKQNLNACNFLEHSQNINMFSIN